MAVDRAARGPPDASWCRRDDPRRGTDPPIHSASRSARWHGKHSLSLLVEERYAPHRRHRLFGAETGVEKSVVENSMRPTGRACLLIIAPPSMESADGADDEVPEARRRRGLEDDGAQGRQASRPVIGSYDLSLSGPSSRRLLSRCDERRERCDEGEDRRAG